MIYMVMFHSYVSWPAILEILEILISKNLSLMFVAHEKRTENDASTVPLYLTRRGDGGAQW